MLASVDEPYLVQREDNRWANLKINRLSRIKAIGPEGWNLAVKEVLAR